MTPSSRSRPVAIRMPVPLYQWVEQQSIPYNGNVSATINSMLEDARARDQRKPRTRYACWTGTQSKVPVQHSVRKANDGND